MIKTKMIRLIKFYQRRISPLAGPKCRYYPSCSQYMLICIERFGSLKGVALGLKRLIKCVPWCRGGIDDPPNK